MKSSGTKAICKVAKDIALSEKSELNSGFDFLHLHCKQCMPSNLENFLQFGIGLRKINDIHFHYIRHISIFTLKTSERWGS